MTPATLIRDATADGVELRIVGGALKASGDREAVNRWLPMIRANKPALLELLRAANEPVPADPEPDRGPNFADLDPEGRAAGEHIYRALMSPRPKAEPVARPDVAHDPTPALPLAAALPRPRPRRGYLLAQATFDEVLALHPDAIVAVPFSEPETASLRVWLDSIGEDDPIVTEAFWSQVSRDPEARRYFLGFADAIEGGEAIDNLTEQTS